MNNTEKNNKYFLIGFLIAIIPFLLLTIVTYISKGVNIFTNTIIVIGSFTSVLNGHILKKHAQDKMDI